MANALTVKGQVTIPKRVRDALDLKPGDAVDFVLDERGMVVVRRASARVAGRRKPDGIDRARGSADHKWSSTAEYMKFIRGEDYEIGKE